VNSFFKKAFTLIEVNLAIFIMAGGVLAMISLYSLGFRESRQSREDVAASAMADAILNPLVVALSSRDLTWSQWKSLRLQRNLLCWHITVFQRYVQSSLSRA
jgi:hypothetical protein